jgi:hypothetical protein
MSNNKSPEVQLKELLEATLSKTQAFSEKIEAMASDKTGHEDRMAKMEAAMKALMEKVDGLHKGKADAEGESEGEGEGEAEGNMVPNRDTVPNRNVVPNAKKKAKKAADGEESEDELINNPHLPEANESDPTKLPKAEPADAELTHQNAPAESDQEVINNPKLPKAKKALMPLDKNEKELEKQEETVHQDLDYDNEEGEPEEHKKKVLGKKAKRLQPMTEGEAEGHCGEGEADGEAEGCDAEGNSIGGVNPALNTVQKGVTMNKSGKPDKKGIAKVQEEEDGDVDLDEPVNEKYNEDKKKLLNKGKKAEGSDIAAILDSKIEAALAKFAKAVAPAPQAAEVDLQDALAKEIQAKEQAINQFKALNEKFETLMTKVSGLEKNELAVEKKVAQVVSKQAAAPVAVGVEKTDGANISDEEAFKKFEALAGKDQRAFYLANKAKIERHASALLRKGRS